MAPSKKLLDQLKRIENQIQNLDSLSKGLEAEILGHLQEVELCIQEEEEPGQISFDDLPQREQVDVAEGELIEIFSDGSCEGNPGPGGWGSIIRIRGRETELSGSSPKTTNNIMEMTGALEAIRRTPEGSRIVLTTDSQYLIKGITQWIHGWKKKNWKKADGKPVLNQELWRALDEVNSVRKIDWEWIKGHAGHPENERCDELAKRAGRLQS